MTLEEAGFDANQFDLVTFWSVFEHVPDPKRTLAEAVHIRSYNPDEVIYYEGDPGLGLYIVQSGAVRLVIEDEEGQPRELRAVGAFELFGHLSILGDHRRTETAMAVTETEVLGFFRPDLVAMIKRRPVAGAAVMVALAGYMAARQAELFDILAARDGKVAAAQVFHAVRRQVESTGSGSVLER